MGIRTIIDGRSTRPEVEELMRHFGNIERDGRVLRHDEIEQIIGVKRTEMRYRTVVGAFKNRMRRDRGIYLDGRMAIGEGLYVLKDEEMPEAGARKVVAMYRNGRKAYDLAAAARDENLDAIGRLKRDHVLLHVGTAIQSLLGARKALASGPKRPQSLPGRRN